ncbi:MAG: SDR family NAD(P)-dependent oxidoreductase [Candidatus Limimorpha sp.]
MDFKKKVRELKHQQGRSITALVTGASSGMGLMYAEILAKAGCDLLIVSNQEKEIIATADRLSTEYEVKTLPLFQDLALDNAAQSLFDFCEENGLIIDILINNAGMYFFHELDKSFDQKMETMLSLHVLTLTRLCRLFGDEMKKRHFGYILNISSMAARIPFPGITLYSATKAYIKNFTMALHFEMKYYNVGTTVVCPAAIATPLYNLNPRLMKIGLATGIIHSPQWLVKKALKAMFRKRKIRQPSFQNIYGPAFVRIIPNSLKSIIWKKLK